MSGALVLLAYQVQWQYLIIWELLEAKNSQRDSVLKTYYFWEQRYHLAVQCTSVQALDYFLTLLFELVCKEAGTHMSFSYLSFVDILPLPLFPTPLPHTI